MRIIRIVIPLAHQSTENRRVECQGDKSQQRNRPVVGNPRPGLRVDSDFQFRIYGLHFSVWWRAQNLGMKKPLFSRHGFDSTPFDVLFLLLWRLAEKS